MSATNNILHEKNKTEDSFDMSSVLNLFCVTQGNRKRFNLSDRNFLVTSQNTENFHFLCELFGIKFPNRFLVDLFMLTTLAT